MADELGDPGRHEDARRNRQHPIAHDANKGQSDARHQCHRQQKPNRQPCVIDHAGRDEGWEGEQREQTELRLTIKTVPDRTAAVQALFAEHHPYEVPQFLAVGMDASAAYAAWVIEAVSPTRNG